MLCAQSLLLHLCSSSAVTVQKPLTDAAPTGMKRPTLLGVSAQRARNTSADIFISALGAAFTGCRIIPGHASGGRPNRPGRVPTGPSAAMQGGVTSCFAARGESRTDRRADWTIVGKSRAQANRSRPPILRRAFSRRAVTSRGPTAGRDVSRAAPHDLPMRRHPCETRGQARAS